MNPASAPSTAVYVYCVAPATSFGAEGEHLSSPAIGTRDGPVRTVSYEDLVAVVSDSPNIRYTLRREYLDAHQRVLGEALARSDILPVSFGSVAQNDRQVREMLLKRQFDDLHGHLEYVRDRVELDVRVFWEQEQLFSEIVAEYGAIGELQASIAGGNPDATHFARIELGEMTEAAMREKSEEEAARVLEVLEPLAVESKLNPEQTEVMVLNAAFLVARQRKDEFDSAVEALTESSRGRLVIQQVGPVAPYNFVTIHIAWNG